MFSGTKKLFGGMAMRVAAALSMLNPTNIGKPWTPKDFTPSPLEHTPSPDAPSHAARKRSKKKKSANRKRNGIRC